MSLKEWVIAGYARRIQRKLKQDIPNDICLVISMFYHDNDYWDYKYSNKTLTITNLYITSNKTIDGYRHLYGEEVICKDGYFHWTLKVHGNISCVYIGIIKNDPILLSYWGNNNNLSWNWNRQSIDSGVLFICAHKCIRYLQTSQSPTYLRQGIEIYRHNYVRQWYGEECGDDGDIIEMIVDLSNDEYEYGFIRYIINGRDYGIACDTIPKSCAYRLSVCVHNLQSNAKIQLC